MYQNALPRYRVPLRIPNGPKIRPQITSRVAAIRSLRAIKKPRPCTLGFVIVVSVYRILSVLCNTESRGLDVDFNNLNYLGNFLI